MRVRGRQVCVLVVDTASILLERRKMVLTKSNVKTEEKKNNGTPCQFLKLMGEGEER